MKDMEYNHGEVQDTRQTRSNRLCELRPIREVMRIVREGSIRALGKYWTS